MNPNGESKFSAIAYLNHIGSNRKRIGGRERNSSQHEPSMRSDSSETSLFDKTTNEIRNELAAPRGRTEEEKRRYQDALNRAILGFEEEREKLLAVINDLLAKKRLLDVPPPDGKFATLADAVFAEVIGLNVLELILKNRDGLEEIQVVGTHLFEVRNGFSTPSAYRFSTLKEVERIQQNLVLYNNDTLSPRKRWAEVMLQDGSRVTMTGFGFTAEPTLTIRFFTVKQFSLKQLCEPGQATINEPVKRIIETLIRSRFNMVVIGSTNSGKTHLLKAIIAEMPDHERLITIESRRELMIKRDFPQKNVIEYEIDEEDQRHKGSQAFKLALRQSPERICHAEIRDEDANVYVRACTRGHEGSLTTVHANELEDVPDTITDMCMLDGRNTDPDRLRKRIARYVTQIGIQMAIVAGKRKIVRIGEYRIAGNELQIRVIAAYDNAPDRWIFPEPFSDEASRRIHKHDANGYKVLLERGQVRLC